MTISLFNQSWYDQRINQDLRSLGDDVTPDGYANAKAIMTAGAFIAEAISMGLGARSTAGDDVNVTDALQEIAGYLSELSTNFEKD